MVDKDKFFEFNCCGNLYSVPISSVMFIETIEKKTNLILINGKEFLDVKFRI